MSRVRIQYLGIKEINGPLIVLDGVKNAHFDEMADIVLDNGEVRHGRVIRLDGEKAVTVHMNCTKGVIYAYNDGQFDTGETDNIYVVFMQSLFDRWFGYDLPGFRQVVIHKSGDDVSGYTAPKIWYIEDITDPNVRKTALEDYIIK